MHTTTDDSLLNLHVAEYSMLAARCTSLINISYGLIILIASLLSYTVSIWERLGNDVWLILSGFQLLTILWLNNSYEILTNTIYIEIELRRVVKDIVGIKTFWGYDSFIKSLSGRILQNWMERITILTLPCMYAIACYITGEHIFCRLSIAGLLLNFFLSFIIYRWVMNIVITAGKYNFKL